jgi:glyoxylase-like metal-dependent hydrolase (beta-lactamase superfamily II)
LQGTNTWLLGAGKGRILVDTGEDITAKEYVNLLLDKVFPSTGTEYLTAILLTHGHGDHQGGVIDLLRELRRRKMLPLPKICKRIVPDGDFPPRDFVCEHIEDGQRFVVESSDSPQAEDGACNTERRSTRSASKSKRPVITATIEAIYTPGHTDDHVAFFVHEDAALLSGDCVLGCGTTVFDHLPTYMQSLQKLKNLTLPPALRSSYCNACVDNKAESPDASNSNLLIKAIYPGHGPVISEDVTGKVDSYIEHRAMRERQILAQLSALKPNGEWISTWELMNKVYPSLAAYVKVSAQWNVLHHLDKLNGEGIVETKFPDLWRLKK